VTASSNDRLRPAASTATSVTSARPIINAAAADAVRAGLRNAFRFARSLTVRSRRSAGNSRSRRKAKCRTAQKTSVIGKKTVDRARTDQVATGETAAAMGRTILDATIATATNDKSTP